MSLLLVYTNVYRHYVHRTVLIRAVLRMRIRTALHCLAQDSTAVKAGDEADRCHAMRTQSPQPPTIRETQGCPGSATGLATTTCLPNHQRAQCSWHTNLYTPTDLLRTVLSLYGAAPIYLHYSVEPSPSAQMVCEAERAAAPPASLGVPGVSSLVGRGGRVPVRIRPGTRNLQVTRNAGDWSDNRRELSQQERDDGLANQTDRALTMSHKRLLLNPG